MLIRKSEGPDKKSPNHIAKRCSLMSRYEVKNEYGMEVCSGILQLFFGNLWESTLDRLDHQIDGYLRSLHFKGLEYLVYRRIDETGVRIEMGPEVNVKRLTAVGEN